MLKSFYKPLFLVAMIFGASLSVPAQACGYSTVTIYLQDAEGNAIKNAAFKFVAEESSDEKYFKSATGTAWNAKRGAYVLVHGMCGGHWAVRLRVTAEGFETTEQEISMRLGAHGYLLKLKRRGTGEKVTLDKLACQTQDECPFSTDVGRLAEN